MLSNTQRPESSLQLALIVGLVWAVVQFGISEAIYQTANSTGYDGELLYDMSDTVAWPAGILYDQVERELMQEELAAMEATAEDQSKFQELRERLNDPEDEAAYGAAWEVFEADGRDPYITAFTEYSIYGGVCIFWGVMVGSSVGFAHFLRKGI